MSTLECPCCGTALTILWSDPRVSEMAGVSITLIPIEALSIENQKMVRKAGSMKSCPSCNGVSVPANSGPSIAERLGVEYPELDCQLVEAAS